MKFDTKGFGEMALICDYFNVALKAADTFLVQMSVKKNVVAGSDVRQLRQQRKSNSDFQKHLLTLTPEDMQKLKACEEMIHFEKADPSKGKLSSMMKSPQLAVV